MTHGDDAVTASLRRTAMVKDLASHRRCVEATRANWSVFLEKRCAKLKQQEPHGVAVYLDKAEAGDVNLFI